MLKIVNSCEFLVVKRMVKLHVYYNLIVNAFITCIFFLQDWLKSILNIKPSKAIFHSSILRSSLDKHNEWRFSGYSFCDPTVVAIALQETIVTKSRDVFATVELQGRLSRGQMISDSRNLQKTAPNVKQALEIDTNLMMEMFSSVFEEKSNST